MKDESIPEDVYPFVIDVVEGIWKQRMIEEDIKVFYFILSNNVFFFANASPEYNSFLDWSFV